MEIEYTPEKEDAIAFALFNMLQSPPLRHERRNGLIISSIMLFLATLTIATLLITVISKASISTSLLIGLAISLFITIPSSISLSSSYKDNLNSNTRKRISASIDSGRNRGWLCKHRLVLDEEGLSTSSEYGEGHTKWSGIERVEQNDDYIFIYFNFSSAIVLNKKHFPSESAAADFFSFAAEHIERAQQPA